MTGSTPSTNSPPSPAADRWSSMRSCSLPPATPSWTRPPKRTRPRPASSATRLRLPRTALPALGEALDGLGEARTKQRALVLADLAANHRALGDHDQARELAAQAQAIGDQRHSAKVLQRVRLAA